MAYRPDRRRLRNLKYESRSVNSSYLTHNMQLCCDIVNRMRDDINCLCQDAKRLARQKSDCELLQKKYEGVCADLKQRWKDIPRLKIQHCNVMNGTHIYETREFLKYTWSLVSSSLEKKAKKTRFMSTRGVSAVDYTEELIAIGEIIQRNYSHDFQHVECSALYTHLTNQLHGLLSPEVLMADHIEILTQYTNYAMTTMIYFLVIVDLYIRNPRLHNFRDICNDIFFNTLPTSNKTCRTPAIKFLASYLRGPLLGYDSVRVTRPIVEGRDSSFYQMASELAHHILENSPENSTPPAPIPLLLLGPGLLEMRFQNTLRAARSTPTPSYQTTRLTTPRGRGRPRKRSI